MGTEFSFELKIWVSKPTIEEAHSKLKAILEVLYLRNQIQNYDIYKQVRA